MFNRFLKYLFFPLITLASISLSGCFGKKEDVVIRMGVTAGPHVEIMEFVKTLAQKQNINIKIIEFNDFILPNLALNDKEIDINCFQHKPFLDEQIASRGYHLVPIGNSILLPMKCYSLKYNTIALLPDSAHIGIPNDPTNEGRALLLLEKLGLLTLDHSITSLPSVLNILDNPKHLKIKTLEAPQLSRALVDLDAAVINTDFALLGGLTKDEAIASESKDSPYTNLFVVREADNNNPLYLKLISIYQSPATAKFIRDKFQGAIIPAW